MFLGPLLTMVVALGQPAQQAASEGVPRQPGTPDPPLAGPAVAPRHDRPTLVERDFSNRLRRPQSTPEEAALSLFTLDAVTKARIDAILAARAAAMDRFVSGNLLLLGELDTAGKAGDTLDQLATLAELVRRLRPVLDNGPLEARIAAALPPDAAPRFRALLAEYWRAVIKEGVAESRTRGKNDPRWAVHLGERLRHLGEEIARSYERQAAAGTIGLDYLLSDLDLSDEQRATMLSLKIDFLERTDFKPTEKQQQLFIAGALGYLNHEQRAKVLAKIAAM
jgi:hypothetical protein